MDPERIKGLKEQLDCYLEENSIRTIKHKDVLSSLLLEGMYVSNDLRVTSSNIQIKVLELSLPKRKQFQQNQPIHHVPTFIYENCPK